MTTDNPNHVNTIAFCLVGRVVAVDVLSEYEIRLTYSDGRTALINPDNYGDTLQVTFGYPEAGHVDS